MSRWQLRMMIISLVVFSPIGALQSAEYTTFIADANDYRIARVVADSMGNTYVAGTRLLTSSSEIFVAKLDAAGNIVLFRTLSGQGNDVCMDMALDGAGNIYVGGSTSSRDFPVHTPLQAAPGPGFLLKLNPDASALLWSTYFREAITGLALDSSGNVYVTGSTNDPKFPVTAGLPQGMVSSLGLTPVSGAFLTKISASGDRILYSGVLAGNAKDCGFGSGCFLSARHTGGVSVAVDSSGNAYLAGNTDTSDLPTTTGALLQKGTGAFIAKVNAGGTALVYLTYVGATHCPLSPNTNPANTATAISADAVGNAYLAGKTFDPAFPATPGAYQTRYSGPASACPFPLPATDVFVLKLNPTGSGVVWGTYLGGSAADVANSVAVDLAGQVWLVGATASPDFPNAQGWSQGSDFVSGLDASGSKLVYSARYPNDGASRAVAADASGLLHVAGPTGTISTIMPGSAPTPRIFGVANAAHGPLDARVAAGEVISIYGPHIGPATPVVTQPDSSGNLPTALPGYQLITSLPNPQPLPLLYASDSQINAVIPFLSYAAGPIHMVTPNGTLADFPLTTVAAAPQIFHNADGSPLVVNQDGSFNSSGNPALLGSTVSIWITGSSPVIIANAGGIATVAQNYYCCGVQVGQAAATVVYAGTAPGSVFGISQVNFQVPTVPQLVNPTPITLVVTAKDHSSIPVTLHVGY